MYINGRVKILTKKGTIILHLIDVKLAIPKTMTVAHSSLIVLSSSNPIHLPFPLSTNILIDISNAEYQTRILPHSSLIVLFLSNHHKRQLKDILASWRIIYKTNSILIPIAPLVLGFSWDSFSIHLPH